MHQGIQKLVTDLNRCLKTFSVLYELDNDAGSFRWVDADVENHSVYIFMREAPKKPAILVVVNLTPVVHHDWRIGVPQSGCFHEVINTDQCCYGGSGVENPGKIITEGISAHGFDNSVSLTLPPLGTLLLCYQE